MSVKAVLLLSSAFYRADASSSCVADGTSTYPVSLLQTGLHRVASAAFDFESYVEQFQREYVPDSDEYEKRFTIFQEHWDGIQAHNAKPNRLWTAGFNHLTDRSHSELASMRGWRKVSSSRGDTEAGLSFLATRSQVRKEEIDWRSLSMAKDIPDQGGCGSCWAVATSVMLEARYEVQKKANRSFSAQQLVNCVPNPKECGGSGGCMGATVELALAYVQHAGLEEGNDAGVPYLGSDQTCLQPLDEAAAASFETMDGKAQALISKHGASHGIGMKSWFTLPSNQAGPLMSSLADGPVAIAAAASVWSFYMAGVFDTCKKDAVINHAVVLFGYGKDEEKGVKYWLVRNSWGPDWGEDGYIRVLRQDTPALDDAHCGMDDAPGDGIACKPYPDEQEVCGMCGMLFDSVAVDFA